MKKSSSRGDVRAFSPHSPKQVSFVAGVSGLAHPVYRMKISHGSIAELAEGFRVLSEGQRSIAIPRKDIFQLTQKMGLHITEDDFNEAMRVVAQTEQRHVDELTFTEFLHIMIRKVDETMAEEMRSAFHLYDKHRTGFVTRKQFTELFATMGERSSPEEVDELLLMADVGELDDKINYNKFITELAHRLNGM